MKLLHDLGDEAAGPGGVMQASFVMGALRELSIGLIRGNYFMYHACVGALLWVTGRSLRTGKIAPTDDPLV
jgi:hypothetical protein